MTDSVADTARLMKVVDALIIEFERQGIAEALGFEPTEMARAAIRAADGDVITLPTLPTQQ
jgi:hypothetical protein